MNKDTHGATGKEWIGFDLDGTLARYDGWNGIDNIGEPVKPMVDIIKKLHVEGKVVKILTARVAPRANAETKGSRYPDPPHVLGWMPPYAGAVVGPIVRDGSSEDSIVRMYARNEWTARDFVADWCLEHLGFLPEITHEKDHLMMELYDDRVKQVVPNEGTLVEDNANAMVDAMVRVHNILQGADDKNWADCIRQAQVEMSEFI